VTFTCALCGGTFEKGRSDDEALEEARENFGADMLKAPQGVICEDCYQEFMSWFLGGAQSE
jgi:hypothetical protein